MNQRPVPGLQGLAMWLHRSALDTQRLVLGSQGTLPRVWRMMPGTLTGKLTRIWGLALLR